MHTIFEMFHLIFNFFRRGPGQEFVRSTLEDIIEQLVDYEGSLEIDCLKVFIYSSNFVTKCSKFCF